MQWRPWASLEVAGYGTVGHVAVRPEVEDPNGLNGRATSSYRFFDRVYVQGWRRRLGGDAEWRRAAWRATAEVLRVDDQRLGRRQTSVTCRRCGDSA